LYASYNVNAENWLKNYLMENIFENCKYCGEEVKSENQRFNLVECQNCRLIFSSKRYHQTEFEEVYDRLYNSENPKYKLHSIKEYEEIKNNIFRIGYNRKRIINQNLKNNSKILEIGSGIGLMGSFIKNKFPESYYTGIEIDEKISEKARSFGLNIKNGDFTIMESINEKFDVVLMWEVLEHIQDLKKCVDLIAKRLDTNGLFIFSVPNYDKRANYKNKEDCIYQDGPPIHLNFFREQSINKIFNSQEFEILSCKKKKLPYLNLKSIRRMFFKIIAGKYQGPTIFCIIKRK